MVPKSLEKYVERMLLTTCLCYICIWISNYPRVKTPIVTELASGDLEKFIPVTIPGPSTSMEDLDIKLEGSRPPSSSHTSLSEDVLSPPSQYYSEEEDEEEDSDQDDQADSDLEVN